MGRRDVRTGLEELVGASVVDPVEHHTWTIELSVGVGVVVPNSALVGPVQCSVRPGQLLHCKVTMSIDVYQRLNGPGPFHSLGDFEDFVALLFPFTATSVSPEPELPRAISSIAIYWREPTTATLSKNSRTSWDPGTP
jgi:hypothetical protein